MGNLDVNAPLPQPIGIRWVEDPPTLRERFAMAALTGILANPAINLSSPTVEQDVAADAWLYADTMLLMREKLRDKAP